MVSKRALLIGINYTGTSSELSGCIHDVENVKKCLLERGYREDKITVITDETPLKPTRANILQAILSLFVSDDKYLYFHYSGHGGSLRDYSGDEKDGRDECLCPLDSIGDSRRLILDDEWRGLLKYLRKNQSLFAVLDCCHSGTGMDLAYSLYQKFGLSDLRMVRERNYPKTKGRVVMLSGCLDPQTSADAWEEGQAQGALTYSFLKTLKRNHKLSYQDLILGIQKILKKRGYAQTPTLSSGRQLKLSTKFLL